MKELLLSYYGDDFTGSTDVMESLALNGIPTALFLQTPSQEEVEAFRLKNHVSGSGKRLQAFGVAGISRSLTPREMDEELPAIFEKLSKVTTRFFHYKTCSTFDSSPSIGSIGHAIDIAYQYFPSRMIPLLIGAPSLNRFCIFGNLFARVDGVTYRLDRHPTMSRHPVTPMDESDIRLHLAKQTDRKVHLIDLFTLEADQQTQYEKVESLPIQEGEYILFDIYNDIHLNSVGKLIYRYSKEQQQLLVGSSGIEYAICQYLQENDQLQRPSIPASPGKAEQLIVVGGSCSPPTQRQLEWAIGEGFADIRLNTVKLVNPDEAESQINRARQQMFEALEKKQNMALYTALGPDDPAINATHQEMEKLGRKDMPSSALLAGAQGRLLKEVMEKAGKKRVVVAGGDTSGYVSRALGIFALETLMPIAPGAPLCTAHSHHPDFDGLEICLKGGQNGKQDFFGSILHGKDIS
ncbi:four-carbon acid sugar kinase family protein [Catalinimonas sp. 4WD22]|uniref:four-carbon acid sugar kinase family protein n=1 Tax=Catalinimonas locisalis TaxID=3133978 RepID=UPI003100F133